MAPLSKRLTAEALGTGFLLTIVVGSGIMGERLAGGSAALALLANSLATGGGLGVLILLFGPISGGHFNPVVTLALAARGALASREAAYYAAAQVAGALAGVAVAHLMFGEPLYAWSTRPRTELRLVLGEFVATFGLLALITACARRYRTEVTALAVAAYITGAYWFTSSTSFANPAVTLARAVTDTFAGIRPDGVPGFLAAQVLGGIAGAAVAHWLYAAGTRAAAPVPVGGESAPDPRH